MNLLVDSRINDMVCLLRYLLSSDELDALGPEADALDMALLAGRAFIAQVCLLRGLLAGHLPFGDRRLRITAKVAVAACPASFPCTILGAVAQA